MRARLRWIAAFGAFAIAAAGAPVFAAQLGPKTREAFERYVRLSEARMDEEVRSGTAFFWTDTLPPARRKDAEARLRRGEVLMDRLEMPGKDVPDGMIHHWVGLVFVPGASAAEIVSLLQDYDRHAEIFKPHVERSRTLWRDGRRFRLFLRFHMKKVLSVTLDTESEAEFFHPDSTRAYSRIRSTRVAEVAEAGTAQEHEKPIENDTGFMWRLNTYWRVGEGDGGAYVQCESISLSRDIPFGLGWIIGPFVTGVPRESLQFTLGRVLFTARKSLPAR
ncbi:MAG: hypothetical protein HYU53_02225 [Acidobacteria bacterium]|nr:hypothetical protein [Acidobacteriota bacterium]